MPTLASYLCVRQLLGVPGACGASAQGRTFMPLPKLVSPSLFMQCTRRVYKSGAGIAVVQKCACFDQHLSYFHSDPDVECLFEEASRKPLLAPRNYLSRWPEYQVHWAVLVVSWSFVVASYSLHHAEVCHAGASRCLLRKGEWIQKAQSLCNPKGSP